VAATLIVNPWASRVTPEVVAAVERELESTGSLETMLTQGVGHATELAADASLRSDRIYVLSGDGGFNEVVNGVGDDVAVGFIPGGGTSVLPRALGLPRDPVEAARALAPSDAERVLSLGRVVGYADGAPALERRFTFAAGLGVDAALVRAVDARGRRGGRRPGDLAFVAEAVRLLAARDHLRRTVQRRGYPERIPGAVREILHSAGDHAVLGRHTGERRRHTDGLAAGIEHQEPALREASERLFDVGRVGTQFLGHLVETGRTSGLGRGAVDGELDSCIEFHRASFTSRTARTVTQAGRVDVSTIF